MLISSAAADKLKGEPDCALILVEDAQEAFIKAFAALGRYRRKGETRFVSWLLTIARRQSIAALRKKKPIPNPDPVVQSSDPWQAAPDDSASRQLWALASKHLSPEARAALWLHYREELPLDQVARVLGKRTGAVAPATVPEQLSG